MSWTYGGDPKNSDRDKIRLLVGDTDSSNQLVTDEEIDWALDRESSIFEAAALTAEFVAASFARNPDKQIRDLSVKFSQTISSYRELAEEYKQRSSGQGTWKDLAPGLSQDTKDSYDDDDDLVKPILERDQHEIVDV